MQLEEQRVVLLRLAREGVAHRDRERGCGRHGRHLGAAARLERGVKGEARHASPQVHRLVCARSARRHGAQLARPVPGRPGLMRAGKASLAAIPQGMPPA